MTGVVKVTNNAFGTLASSISSSATTIALDSGQGARFPTLSSPDYFYGTLIDTSNNLEIVKVTARSTDSLTVTRAQDNTSARAFSTGDRFELRPTAKLFEDIQTNARDLNGQELILDADGDTSITADTDDQIDIKIAGSDRMSIKASGSTSVNLDAGGSMKLTVGDSDSHQFVNGSDTVLTIDSSGNATFDGVVTVGTSSKTTDTDIKLSNDNKTFGIRADRAGSYFSVVDFSAGSNRLVITSSGNVGIGTTNGDEYPLFVKGSNVSSGGGLATLCVLDSGTAYNGTNPGGGITFRGKFNSSDATTNFATVQGIKENSADGNYDTALRFTTRANGGNLTEKMRIDSSGDVTISDGNLVIGTSGHGIDFSATGDGSGTDTSELLDDYEEGTWTPSVRGSSTAGTASYLTRIARYTKIGNLIHVNFVLQFNISSAAGDMEITGFPYAGSGSEPNDVGVLQHNQAGASYASGVANYVPYMSSAVMSFRGNKNDGTTFESLAIQNMSYMRVTFVYTQA